MSPDQQIVYLVTRTSESRILIVRQPLGQSVTTTIRGGHVDDDDYGSFSIHTAINDKEASSSSSSSSLSLCIAFAGKRVREVCSGTIP